LKSIIYALIGLTLYAVQNTIIDVRLKQFSTLSLLVVFYLTMLPLGLMLLVYQKYTGEQLTIPTGDSLKIVVVVAIMFFIADFFYIGAYTSGGSAVPITILAALVPVVCALMKFVWVREVPTNFHFAGFVCALLAVAFIAFGNSRKPLEVGVDKLSITEEVKSIGEKK
jgi:drug/metabolite transporter (DMT)-like permease